MGLDEELDRLYGLPLDDFTSARDRLADELRRSGDAAAGDVKRLKKPNVAAWAVNQLARRQRHGLGDLLALRQSMEKAPDARELRRAAEARRRLTAELLGEARTLLVEAGHSASPETLQRVMRTLLAGGNEEERAAMLRGRLTRDLAPSGFEQELGAQVEPEPSRVAATDERTRRALEKSEQEAVAAEAEAERLEQVAAAARREAQRAAQEAESAAAEAALARRRAAGAREKAERAANRMSF